MILVSVDRNPDFILLTETWTNESINDASLQIPNYVMECELRKDRKDTGNGIGGGLLVYRKEGIKILPNNYDDNSFNQLCGFKILTKSDPLNIILVYRPPSSSVENLEKLCTLLGNLDPRTVVIGDFNLPGICWTNYTADAKGRRLLETVEEAGLDQLVEFATHIKGNKLDLVITNCGDKVIAVEEAGRLGRSDHSMLVVEIDIEPSKSDGIKTWRAWRRADWEGMKNLLQQTGWSEMLRRGTVNGAWEVLTEKLNEAVEEFVPSVQVKKKNRPKWLDKELLRLIRQKKRAWKTFKNHGTQDNLEKYKKN